MNHVINTHGWFYESPHNEFEENFVLKNYILSNFCVYNTSKKKGKNSRFTCYRLVERIV